MKFDDYTPDRICAALGVGKFKESWRRGLPARQIRVLLAPSFNREASITLSEGDDGMLLVQVAAAREQFWQHGFEVGADVENLRTSDDRFDRFEMMLQTHLPVGRRAGIVIDGIPIYLAYRSLQTELEIRVNPAPDEPFGVFIYEMREMAARLIEGDAIRKTLASAWYSSKRSD